MVNLNSSSHDLSTSIHLLSGDPPQRERSPSPTREDEGDSPKAKSRLSKILSNVQKVNEESKGHGTNAAEFSSNDVLGTVKFDAGVLREVESSRCAL